MDIYNYIYHQYIPNISICINTMDPMGYTSINEIMKADQRAKLWCPDGTKIDKAHRPRLNSRLFCRP